MATDDRDTESSNPSKSFKVGEFDRLSGFFTPVWESKRRLRADSPVPSSSAAASAPSSARDSDKAATSRPSRPPPSAAPPRRSSPPPAPARRPSSPPEASAAAAPAQRSSTPPAEPARRSSTPLPAPARRPSARPAAAETPALQPSSPPAAAASASPAERSRHARASSPARPGAKATQAPARPSSAAADAELTPLMDAEVAPTPGAALLVAPSHGDDSIAATLAPGDRQGPSNAADTSPVLPSQRASVVDSDPSDGDARVAAALHSAAAVTVRPVIPMPDTPGRATQSPKAPSSSPSAAAVGATRTGRELGAETRGASQVSPNAKEVPNAQLSFGASPRQRRVETTVAAPRTRAPGAGEPGRDIRHEESGPEAVLDRALDVRAPAAVPPDRRGAHLRSAVAGAGATALQDKLRTKPPSDSVDTFARHRETESEREALQAAAARAAATPADPYPSQVLRRLRRTIHLSTPLPDAVRQMLEKYR